MKPNKAFQVKIQKSKVKSETPKNVAWKALFLFGYSCGEASYVPEPNLHSDNCLKSNPAETKLC
ncbi:hypothetical protein [Dapis sp. BLCC M172]|uniref:hypothetical protein n=1 Tax=Dapis sp. BLCC M172 TaxID=2975281 RepID=UPI003CFA5944